MATGLDTEFTTAGRRTVARYDRYEEAQARGRVTEHYDVTVPDDNEQRARTLIAQTA